MRHGLRNRRNHRNHTDDRIRKPGHPDRHPGRGRAGLCPQRPKGGRQEAAQEAAPHRQGTRPGITEGRVPVRDSGDQQAGLRDPHLQGPPLGEETGFRACGPGTRRNRRDAGRGLSRRLFRHGPQGGHADRPRPDRVDPCRDREHPQPLFLDQRGNDQGRHQHGCRAPHGQGDPGPRLPDEEGQIDRRRQARHLCQHP